MNENHSPLIDKEFWNRTSGIVESEIGIESIKWDCVSVLEREKETFCEWVCAWKREKVLCERTGERVFEREGEYAWERERESERESVRERGIEREMFSRVSGFRLHGNAFSKKKKVERKWRRKSFLTFFWTKMKSLSFPLLHKSFIWFFSRNTNFTLYIVVVCQTRNIILF